MGFISELVNSSSLPNTENKSSKFPVPQNRGRDLWDQTFGGVSKEEPGNPVRSRNYADPNAYRTINGTAAGQKRLLQAMRSMAPGGWSDDRYEQTRQFKGVQYIAVHCAGQQMRRAEFAVYRKDLSHPDGKVLVKPGEYEYRLVELLERPNSQDTFGDMCFPPGTRVRMADGTNKRIEEIVLLDEVISAEGNKRKVHQLHVRPYDGEMVDLKLWGHNYLSMTPNHPILTKRGYVPAGELTKEDWVCIPKYSPSPCSILQTSSHIKIGSQKCVNASGYVKDVEWGNYRSIPEFIELNRNTGRIFGLFLAEGHTEGYGVFWSFSIKEKDTIVADLVSMLKEEWDLDARTQETESVCQVCISGKLWVQLFRSLCGTRVDTKKPHSDLMCAPDEFLNGLFHGWMDGDGCSYDGKLQGCSVSRDLALSMFDIANHLGWQPTIYKGKPGTGDIKGYVPKKRLPTWNVTVLHSDNPGFKKANRKLTNNYRVCSEGDKIWRRVRSVSKSPYNGFVYNLGVEIDNSYIADAVGVHNCYRWNQQLKLTGMCLTWIVPNAYDANSPKEQSIVEMYVIPTAIAMPQPAISPEFPDGYYRIQPLYPYGPFSTWPTPSSAVGAVIDAKWMMRFMYPHPLLRYDGYSPQSALSLQLDALTMTDRSRFYKLKGSINPSAILNMDEVEGMQQLPEEEIERIHAEWENSFSGPENHGRLIVGTPGGHLEEFGRSPVDMDYPNGWDQLISFNLAGMGMTKSVAFMADESSYSNHWASLKQVNDNSIQPDCDLIASHLTRVVAPFFGDDLIIEIKTARIDDHEIVFNKIDKGIAAKCLTKNDVLKLMDLPVTEEEWGSEIAGYEAPPPGAPGAVPGQPGVAPAGAPGAGAPAPAPPPLAGEGGELKAPDAPEAGKRPEVGDVSKGALGPRKSLNGLYSRGKSVNGNGRHH